MFSSIRTYGIEKGQVDELLREVESGLVPTLRNAPGYLGHYVIARDDGSVVSITGVRERTQLKEANRLAETWAKEHLKRFQIKEHKVSEGEVKIFDRF